MSDCIEPELAFEVITHQLERLARRERGRLVALLVGKLGPARLEMAEDVVQDAVVAAMAAWPYKGMPDNPAAWLNRVARNKAYDRLRKEGREQPWLEEASEQPSPETRDREKDQSLGQLFGARITDPELKLIFLCCQPEIGQEDQLMLTLKVVSGFTAKDIGALFLKKEAAVGQRLARAKRKLRSLEAAQSDASITDGPSRFEVKQRLPTVLKVIYLMFSLGYAPRRGDMLVMRDVAEEALRLAVAVANADETTSAEANALAALLAFQASRFDARADADGGVVLLRDQNRALWNRDLINLGFSYLKAAQLGANLSRYHLEAAIAAGHAAAPDFAATNWQLLLAVYANLEAMTGSPVVAVNACVAEAFAGAPEAAFLKLEVLAKHKRLHDYAPYHIARGELLRMLKRPVDAAACFKKALECDMSAPVLAHLKGRLAASM